jgi:B12-binding domain/radical SAM domain protein
MNDLLIFVTEGYNRYSIAVLAGALDQELPELPLAFWPGKPDLSDRVRQAAAKHRRVVVAYSFMSPQLPGMMPTLEGLQDMPGNVTLVAGGPHASGDPLGTLQQGFDVLVLGEGEVTFPALLRRILAGESYEDVAGIAYLDDDGQLARNRRGPWVNLDDWPPFSIKHNKLATIEITRGCPWACSFCQTPFFLGGKMRYRSVERVVYWLKQAREQNDMRFARFISADCFAYGSQTGRRPDDLEPVEELLFEVNRLMSREHTFFGSFPSEVRPGSVTRKGMALIKKYCANDNVVIGAQSGSNRMLEAIHRGHTIEAVFEAAEIVVAAGLECMVDFIFGLPGETPYDRTLTLAAIRRLTRIGATINSHFFYPLPGTPLADTVAGAPDKETLRFLERLTLEKYESGRWKARLRTLAAMQALPQETLPQAERLPVGPN